jgi:hypothetical protein
VLGCNFLGVELEAFRRERARFTHYHVKQGDAVFLARDTIGFADYELVAMAANEIHAAWEAQAVCQQESH